MTPRRTIAVSQSVQKRCATAIGPRFAAVAIVATERRADGGVPCVTRRRSFRFGCCVAETARPLPYKASLALSSLPSPRDKPPTGRFDMLSKVSLVP
jgi:hypothetical protein